MSPQRDGQSGPSVTGRVLGILSAFGPGAEALSLSGIARAAGLPLSTAHRLVGELAAWGALERGEDGRYRIGLRLWEVGALAPRSLGLRERAMPYLEDLYEATRQNVQLAVRDGHEVVYVERLAHPEAVRVFTRVGGRMPLHATGVGQVLLAFAHVSVQEEVLAGPLSALTPRTVTDPHALRRTLAAVRREGVAVCDGLVDLLSLSVAAPVRGEDDRVVAAMSVVVPSAGSDPRTIVPAVRATARGISRALGSPSARRRPSGVVTPLPSAAGADAPRTAERGA
ncbi:IclR family transcriptional regulator [Actinomycetospora chibensis]|uniref:IclR family transcriptional regulator n=1 Tax=Actinomycetospora chibensis TaxID=663606 RepID=A0ABV9RUZ3_9PSEU|nr:IclR family transcriptional regulator [Actinomycetospora chibensis]MDD7925322.1 IclR family transcriptional regulator [Actinomycetospora chibensis]